MSDFKYLYTKKCCCCDSRLDKLKKTLLRRVNNDELREKLKSVKHNILLKDNKPLNDNDIGLNDPVCNRCRVYATKYGTSSSSNVTFQLEDFAQPGTSSPSVNTVSTQTNTDDLSLVVTMPRAIKSDKQCVICHKTRNLVEVPDTAYVASFINNNVLIPDGAKCCSGHLNKENYIRKKDLDKIEIVCETTKLTGKDVELVMTRLRHHTTLATLDKFGDTKKLNDKDCISYTGYTKEEFLEILGSMKSLRNSQTRNKSQALANYLFWLKTGLDCRTIATIFSIDNFQSVSEYCEQVRACLKKDFMPYNLGAQHLSRDEWTEEIGITPKTIFNVPNNKLMFIGDGTYQYTHKAKYNTLQRKLYGGQKKRHYVKPFVVCTTTGKIVDIFGLFPAVDNDATIMKKIMDPKIKVNDPYEDQQRKHFRNLLKPNDHLLLDRGFRDCIKELKERYSLKPYVPPCVSTKGKQKQLNTLQANTARMISRCRWPVELLNGKLKTRFRANDKVHFNVTLPHLMDDLRISAAVLNKFHKPYALNNDTELAIAEKMKSKLNTSNRLIDMFDETHIDKKRTVYHKMDRNSVPDFPRLDYQTILKEITLGEYQLKQASGYIHENFDEDGAKYFEILDDKKTLGDDDTVLLRTRVQSRHMNNTIYKSFITYSKSQNKIKDTFCTCKTGARTVGTCSHVASVIYYLGNARFNTTKSGKYSIDKIFPEHTLRESSDEDTDTEAADFHMFSDTEIEEQEDESRDQSTVVAQVHSNTLYPNLSDFNQDD